MFIQCKDCSTKETVFQNSPSTASAGTTMKNSSIAAVDTVIWQGLASVIIPGFTINRICWVTNKVLHRVAMADKMKKIVVIAMGLGSIPLIIKPIDHSVEVGMDVTLRKLYGSSLR